MPAKPPVQRKSPPAAASVPSFTDPPAAREAAYHARLTSYGLTPAEAEALGWKTLSAEETKGLGLWAKHSVPAIAIPYLDVGGKPVMRAGKPFHRYRALTTPDPVPEGWAKFLQLDGTGTALYVPHLPGLDWPAIRTDASVPLVITEAEAKAAAAAKHKFPAVAVAGVSSWRGSAPGSLLDGLDDFTWKDRRVLIVFDHDVKEKSGSAIEAQRLAVALRGRGAVARIVVLPLIFGPTEKVGLDDYLRECDAAEFRKLIEEAESPLPPGFAMTKTGLHHSALVGDHVVKTHVTGPFEIVGTASDEDGHGHSTYVRWSDGEGREHLWAVPKALTHKTTGEIGEALSDGGLYVNPEARKHLNAFFAAVAPESRLRLVRTAGWHRDADRPPVFVLPSNKIVGADDAGIIFQSERPLSRATYRTAGTLDGWKEKVAALAVGNDRIAFFVSAAFVGPILKLAGADNVLIYLRGRSSIGKTTALIAGASAWGSPTSTDLLRSWSATVNGMEAAAAEANESLLAIDELGLAEPRDLGDIVYLLGNGIGKQRADRHGGARARATFAIAMMGTGEVGLDAKLAEAGKRGTAGMEVRFLEIPAEAGAVTGLIQNLHGRASSRALVEELKSAAAEHHGFAARAFLNHLATALAKDEAEVRSRIADAVREFIEKHTPPGDVDGQVMRVLRQFAVVAAAGELAQHYKVLPWKKGEASRAAAACFRAWLEERGGAEESAEERRVVEQVRHFIERHAQDRFVPMIPGTKNFPDPSPETVDPTQIIHERAGWAKPVINADGEPIGTDYLITPEVWKREVVKGFDPKFAARVLADRDLLVREGDRLQRTERIPGEGTPKVYRVRHTIIERVETPAGTAEVVALASAKSKRDRRKTDRKTASRTGG